MHEDTFSRIVTFKRRVIFARELKKHFKKKNQKEDKISYRPRVRIMGTMIVIIIINEITYKNNCC